MSERRLKVVWPIIVALTLMPLMLPALYTVAYCLRSGSRVPWPGNFMVVGYRTEWESQVFVPAARLEGYFTGQAVHTVGPRGEIR